MNFINIIGWIGNIFFVLGAILLTKKKKLGFYCNAIGNLIYIYFAILISKDSLLILSLFLMVVNVWGIYNWRIKRIKNEWVISYLR